MQTLDLEIELGELIGNYSLSNEAQDVGEHWDVNIKFDVKSQPKNPIIGARFRWVELVNVRGAKGSMYGKAHYLAFEESEYFIIVNRAKLLQHVLDRLSDHEVSQSEWRRNPLPYMRYTRAGRHDVITLVPIIDLCYLGRVVKRQPSQLISE